MTRTAIYLRISLDQTGEGLAVARQREDALDLANLKGWDVVDIYQDNSISASKRKVRRPEYDRMVSDYLAGRFEAIICYDLDRLTRQPRQLEDWIEWAEEKGLKLVTLNGEADLSTDGGRMYARVKAAVARAEVDRKSERQARALLQRSQLGKHPLGVRLTGYNQDGSVNPTEAAVVRRIFERFDNSDSLYSIAAQLNADGVPARGEKWSSSTVRTMLQNPRYAGRAVYRGKATGQAGNWEPIVTGELFDAIQARLTDPRRITNREGTARKHLGSGVFVCNVCLQPVQTNGKRYWCKSNGCLIRTMAPIDEKVLTFVRTVLSLPEVVTLVAPSDTDAGKKLDEEAKRQRSRLAVIEADYDNGLIDGQRYRVATSKAQARLREIDARRMALQGDRTLGSIVTAADPAARFEAASLDVKRAVIDAMILVRLNPVRQGQRGFQDDSVGIHFRRLVAQADGSFAPTLSRKSLTLLEGPMAA
ncbi:recombinase family protein [Sphingomonas sp. BLCC-B65]|nr:recombinase family protein [Sphingomonas sp. BLCC-B65]